jgi:hypothetical protein
VPAGSVVIFNGHLSKPRRAAESLGWTTTTERGA